MLEKSTSRTSAVRFYADIVACLRECVNGEKYLQTVKPYDIISVRKPSEAQSPRVFYSTFANAAKKTADFSTVSKLGADDEARTRYLHLGKVALYQMSYIRIFCFFVFVCSLTTMFIIRENPPFVNNILKVFLKNFLSRKMAQLPTPKLRLVHSSESKICRICSGRCTRTSAPYSSSTSLLRNPHVTPTAYRPAFFAVCMSVPESPT